MKNYFDLKDRVAVVTGASSGLGAHFSKVLASQGAKLALIARRLDRLEALKKEIEEEYQTEVKIYQKNLTDFDKLESLVNDIENDFSKIDILVNNAGMAHVAPALEMKQDDWLKMLDTNLSSVFFMSQAVGKRMVKNGYGRIINLASVHSQVTMKTEKLSADQMIAYVTTKHGVRGLTISLAAGWAKYGITVNAIGPGYFESEMTSAMLKSETFKETIHATCPMDRHGDPKELDTTLLYLASENSSYTTGQVITVDGGWLTL